MKRFTFHSAAILLLLAAGPALAAPISFSGGGGMGGGHRHGGRGHGGLDVDAIQNRFEDQLADIMTAYDEGVADSEDYYSSDDYADLVGETEWLVDSYDWFLTSVERTIEHIDDYIASANEDLTFYGELLAEYEARDDLSETRLERIVDWITSAQDMLTLRIETLTYKQTTLEENLSTYTTFQTDLTSYLDEIVAAGGGTVTTGDETDDADAALQALALTGMGDCSLVSEGTATAVTAVPEPSAAAGLVAIAAAAGLRAYRRRHART
jgi:MYXO-CTERM domain-containing protein